MPMNSFGERAHSSAASSTFPYLRRWFQKKGRRYQGRALAGAILMGRRASRSDGAAAASLAHALHEPGVRIDLQAQRQRSLPGHDLRGDGLVVGLSDVADLEMHQAVGRDVALQELPHVVRREVHHRHHPEPLHPLAHHALAHRTGAVTLAHPRAYHAGAHHTRAHALTHHAGAHHTRAHHAGAHHTGAHSLTHHARAHALTHHTRAHHAVAHHTGAHSLTHHARARAVAHHPGPHHRPGPMPWCAPICCWLASPGTAATTNPSARMAAVLALLIVIALSLSIP